MIRSSGIGSGAAASTAVESSHSFQAAFHPCFQRVTPCHRVSREELLLLVLGTGMQFRDLEAKRRQAQQRLLKEGHGGSG